MVASLIDDSKLEQVAENLGLIDGMTEAELDERTRVLHALIAQKMKWEREQIVAVVTGYADDCEAKANELHVVSGDRASAFSIRAAIARDIATKIASGWGRDKNGAAQ